MKRPLIADLFCGAGGAAMGLHRAGFDVVGFDIEPQPRYPFPFVQQDALTVDLSGFDAVWASPPCQYYSRLRHLPWLKAKVYWRSIPPTRAVVVASGLPYIIENVQDARWDMLEPQVVCGQSLGLRLYRHRAFESPTFFMLAPHQAHRPIRCDDRSTLAKRPHGVNGWGGPAGHQSGVNRHRHQMGIDWMTGRELSQAVPPAYSEFLGRQLIRGLEVA